MNVKLGPEYLDNDTILIKLLFKQSSFEGKTLELISEVSQERKGISPSGVILGLHLLQNAMMNVTAENLNTITNHLVQEYGYELIQFCKSNAGLFEREMGSSSAASTFASS